MTDTLFDIGDKLPLEDKLPVAYPERAAWGTGPKLRAWQAEALALYFDTEPKDFLAVATPAPVRPRSRCAWPRCWWTPRRSTG